YMREQKGQNPRLILTASRAKSVGRLARSVEMMTQRPTMGSLRSSGNYWIPFHAVHKGCRARANGSILRLEVNVAEQFDLRLPGWLIVVHADDFEAPRAGSRQMAQVFPGDGHQFTALVPINRGSGGLQLAGSAGLDFDKPEDLLAPAAPLDFA